MSVAAADIPTLRPAQIKNPRLHVGDTWFVILPSSVTVACVVIDEVTRKTVAFRREPDLGCGMELPLARYARADVRFIERLL